MPGSGRDPQTLVDTSVAVALTVADHEQRPIAVEALAGRRLGLSGHAAFETFSVLTRLPPPARRTPSVVAHILAVGFPYTRHLGAGETAGLLAEAARLGITGGSVYDALVGACARQHSVSLATRDRRALETYRALDVPVEFIA